ncbi:MAG: DUF1573 domain-containing protein [Lentisphaeria bacterium]|jgi:hypothetical protein|nr:DUF1573 domain-containing protein [Lentisphaeria bacterium]MDP7740143.1 DUF1573 domain-containing protein [Lentisphaeria bacterium]
MKRICLAFFIAVTAIGYSQTLSFEKKTHDFGDIDDVGKVSTQVKFKNDGAKTLVIEDVRASCGCTAGKPAKKELAPGEESYLDVTFNPQGKRGNQRKSITFKTNDPINPTQAIYITARIKSIWDFQPSKVQFNVQNGVYNNSQERFEIVNNSKKTLSILTVTSSNPNITIVDPENVKRDIEPGSTSAYEVRANTDFVPNRKALYARLTFKNKLGEIYSSRTLSVYIRNLTYKAPRYDGSKTKLLKKDPGTEKKEASGTEKKEATANPEGSSKEGSNK